jgi:DNA replication protein DnaC
VQRCADWSRGYEKTHLAIAEATCCISAGLRDWSFNTVDLLNRLESDTRTGKQGRIADYMTRLDY